MTYREIIKFWFEDIKPEKWFSVDPTFDSTIQKRFSAVYEQAMKGELFSWRIEPLGRLAEIIILDQFSRNIFRNNPKAFESDDMALTLSQEAVMLKIDAGMDLEPKAFLYMPYMHSESKIIHEEAVKLFDQKGMEDHLKYEIIHKKIIDRFGRFPHRNKILGRQSTQEEIEFLKEPNSSF